MDGMKRALFQVHETQAFWALPGGELWGSGAVAFHLEWSRRFCLETGGSDTWIERGRCGHSSWTRTSACLGPLCAASVQRVDYEHLDKEPSTVQLNIVPGAEPLVKVGGGFCERCWMEGACTFAEAEQAPPFLRSAGLGVTCPGAACAHPTGLYGDACTLPCRP